jgi:hypothetical protein
MNHTTTVKSALINRELATPVCLLAVALSCLLALGAWSQARAADAKPRTFSTPQAAADALISAAERFDVPALEAIFGPGGEEIIHSGEPARDQEIAKEFAAQARTKMEVSVDPESKRRAFIVVGNDAWPFPVPIVKTGATWSFDLAAGRDEILFRRIGRNELDAIEICHGFVEAQHEYAQTKHEGSHVNQYAH